MYNLRLRGLVPVVCLASLPGSNRGIVNEFQKMLPIASNDSKLLAVLAHSVELVGESSLELLASDVRQLCFSNQRLGLGTHKLLLKNNNLRRVGLFVLQLSNLVGDLLLAYTLLTVKHCTDFDKLTVTAGLDGCFDVTNALDGDTVLVIAIDILVLELTNLVNQDTELVCDIRNVVVTGLSPDGKLLLHYQLVLI